MRVAIVIPARFASSRFPGKPLAPLRGPDGDAKPLIQWSWEAAMRVRGADDVVVATDDDRIARAAEGFGARVAMTPESCGNGTERCAAALDALAPDTHIVVNLQGDAPLTPPHFVEALIEAMRADDAIAVATPAVHAMPELHRRLLNDQAEGRVGGTTCVRDVAGDALYFSKAVIPHVGAARHGDPALPVFFHVGAYAYRRAALLDYRAARATPLELLEGLEQLRFLENGVPVRVIEVDARGAGIWELNNPEDVPIVEAGLARLAAAAA